MEKDQALGLFVVLLKLFAEVAFEGRKFNKLVVVDEAHKHIESPGLVAGPVEVVGRVATVVEIRRRQRPISRAPPSSRP